jgi:hypothetical protein
MQDPLKVSSGAAKNAQTGKAASQLGSQRSLPYQQLNSRMAARTQSMTAASNVLKTQRPQEHQVRGSHMLRYALIALVTLAAVPAAARNCHPGERSEEPSS